MDDRTLHKLVACYQAEQREAEVVWFYRAAERVRPKVVVEIGIKEGGNLKILSTHLDEGGLCVGVDPRKEIPWKMDDARCVVKHVCGDSHAPETKRELEGLLAGRPVDVLFIDGDHSTAGMLADYDDYASLVRPGGLVAVHDIYYLKEVTAAWLQVRARHREWHESAHVQSSIGIGYVVMP